VPSGFVPAFAEQVQLKQQGLRDSPVQKLTMIFVARLAGAKAVSHTDTSGRVDPALHRAFGFPGGAEPSVVADTLNAATAQDGADLRAAVAVLFRQHRQARQHDFTQDLLVLALDRSPLPTSARADGAERASRGRSRSRTGRTRVRGRATPSQETVWEAVRPGRTAERVPVVPAAIEQAERLVALDGDPDERRATRAGTDGRLDSRWGSTAAINWLLARG
jgi:hypothetical protein